MGLSAMSDMPDMDQAMRYANIAGQMQHIGMNAWLGENSLDGLGLGDGPPVTPDTINAYGGALANVIGAISGAIKSGKKGKGNPAPSAAPVQFRQDAPPEGDSGMSKLLLIGGAVILAGVVIYMVVKKKKNAPAGDH